MQTTLFGGLLVAIEGIDGVGKTTVAAHLMSHCERCGIEAVRSKEPTEGPWGRQLRASAQTGRVSLEEELELFARDRAQHVEELIQPALQGGKVVILDRYYFSTMAYQGARGGDATAILQANEAFAPAPDLILLLDCAPEISLARVRSRGDVPNEFEKAEALAEARRLFLALRRPGIAVIDATMPADEVARFATAALSAAIECKRHAKRTVA